MGRIVEILERASSSWRWPPGGESTVSTKLVLHMKIWDQIGKVRQLETGNQWCTQCMTTGVCLRVGIKSLASTRVFARRERKSLTRGVRRRKMLQWQGSTLTGLELLLSLDSSDKRWRRISTTDVRASWWSRSSSTGKWRTSLRLFTGTAGTVRQVIQCHHPLPKLQLLLQHCQRLPGTRWRLGVIQVRHTRRCLD